VDVDGLSLLTTVFESMYVHGNDQLANLNGLSSMTDVGGILDIWNNADLTDLSGMSGIDSVGGSLFIWENVNLCQSQVSAFLAGCLVNGNITTTGNNGGC